MKLNPLDPEVEIIPQYTDFRGTEALRPPDTAEPTILDTLERCMQQARVLETQGRELYEMMMKTVFRVRGQQETRNEAE